MKVYIWEMSPIVFANYRHIKEVNQKHLDGDTKVEFVRVGSDFGLTESEVLYDDEGERFLVEFQVTVPRPTEERQKAMGVTSWAVMRGRGANQLAHWLYERQDRTYQALLGCPQHWEVFA